MPRPKPGRYSSPGKKVRHQRREQAKHDAIGWASRKRGREIAQRREHRAEEDRQAEAAHDRHRRQFIETLVRVRRRAKADERRERLEAAREARRGKVMIDGVWVDRHFVALLHDVEADGWGEGDCP